MMTIECKIFDELSKTELYEILKLRQEIFIVEQNCPYLDADGKDIEAFHVILKEGEQIQAYTRLLAKGTSYDQYVSIGRVVNRASARGRGFGKQIMQYSIEKIQSLFPGESIKLSAQCYLDKFYNDLGFRTVGESYLEDDIPHQAMIYSVDA